MLMVRSGHAPVRSLATYARVPAEALARHQAGHDPARRRWRTRETATRLSLYDPW